MLLGHSVFFHWTIITFLESFLKFCVILYHFIKPLCIISYHLLGHSVSFYWIILYHLIGSFSIIQIINSVLFYWIILYHFLDHSLSIFLIILYHLIGSFWIM